VSATLSPPVRVAALVGALVVTGLAAFALVLGRGIVGGEPETAATPAPVVEPAQKPAAVQKPAQRPAQPPPARQRVPSGFPPKIDHALRYGRIVVVSVSVPGAAVDAVVRREARAAAAASRVKLVTLSAANERAMAGLVAKTGVLPSPAVVVVKRPGVVAATFSVTDAATISQAVAEARAR
jgi:hypothetical protein